MSKYIASVNIQRMEMGKLVVKVNFLQGHMEECQEYFQSIPTRGDGHSNDDQHFPEGSLACQARLLFQNGTWFNSTASSVCQEIFPNATIFDKLGFFI